MSLVTGLFAISITAFVSIPDAWTIFPSMLFIGGFLALLLSRSGRRAFFSLLALFGLAFLLRLFFLQLFFCLLFGPLLLRLLFRLFLWRKRLGFLAGRNRQSGAAVESPAFGEKHESLRL